MNESNEVSTRHWGWRGVLPMLKTEMMEACTARGGHCFVRLDSEVMDDIRELCKHCPASRKGRRQPSVAYTYPEGQP